MPSVVIDVSICKLKSAHKTFMHCKAHTSALDFLAGWFAAIKQLTGFYIEKPGVYP